MAQIPQIIDTAARRQMPNTSGVRSPQASAMAFGGDGGLQALGQGMAQAADTVGNDLARAAAVYKREQEQLARFNAETAFTNLGSDYEAQFEEKARNLSGDANGFTKQSLADYDARAAEWLKTLPEAARPEWQARIARQRAQVAGQALSTEFRQRDAYYKTTINDQLDKLRVGIDETPDNFDGYRKRGDEIIDASGLSPQLKMEMKSRWSDLALMAYGTAKVRIDPDSVAGTLGGDAGYFRKLRAQESSGDDGEVNAASSARGRYQFLDDTWAGIVNSEAGRAAGLRMDGRGDARQQEAAIRIYTAQSQAALRDAGMPADEKNLYMLHFMGQGGGVDFLRRMQANPSAPAADVFPAAAEANKTVFYKPDGTARTLGEVYSLQTKRFGTGGVAAQASDKLLEEMPYQARLQLREAAEREIVARDNAAATAARAAEAAQWNQLQLDLIDGKAGRAEIDAARQDGWLTDAPRVAQAYNIVEEREKKGFDLAVGNAKLAQDGAIWNPYDKQDRESVEAVVQARGGTPEAALDVWQRTGVLAKAGGVALRGALVSTDTERLTAAAQIASNMLARNPNAFAGVDGQQDIEKAAVAFGHYVNDMGFSAEEAARKVAQMNDPVFKEKFAARDADFKKMKDSLFTVANATSAVSGIFDTWMPGDAPSITPQQKGAVAQDYISFVQEGYLQTGDVQLAQKYAEGQVKKLYGVSNGVLTKYPPERVYPPSNDPDDPFGYIYRQAAETAKAFNPKVGDINPKDVVLVPLLRGQTAEPWRNGRQTPYRLLFKYKDADGMEVWDMTPDGKGFVADPAAEAKRATDQRQREFAKDRAEEEKSMATPLSPFLPNFDDKGRWRGQKPAGNP